MRRFYIFSVREELCSLYDEAPGNLYKILNSIYKMDNEELTYAYHLFKQLCVGIDSLEISNKLYLKMHNDLVYTKLGNEHIINNLYKDEVSILTVKKSHLVLDCNSSYSTFFNFLNKYDKNYFICDFKTGDYFFLKDIELIVN